MDNYFESMFKKLVRIFMNSRCKSANDSADNNNMPSVFETIGSFDHGTCPANSGLEEYKGILGNPTNFEYRVIMEVSTF